MRKILCALALLAFATPLLASDPFVGTWTLNSAKTKYTTGTAPKNVTLVIEEQGASLQVTGTGTTGDGSPISVKYTVPVKGGVGSVMEGDFDGVSSKVVSSHSRVNTFTKAGKEIRTRHAVVSADGKMLSTSVKGTGADGKPVAGEDVYDKQ
ncbi:hypothetical protein [Tunturibacter empetritectus]|uniref:Lipocalin-like domain-containing protein n=1 Tax=Tunturiibacter empetritectus TaxID=3069691 RepID=A0A7W8IJ46_9BACT|nr:hypothetical protein [Edaphobacter lichenicola]MBB5317295.1 hypothetical protein [Edaphobacter lichenicola]